MVKDTLRGARFAVRHSLRSSILPDVLVRTKLGLLADNIISTLEGGVVTNLETAGLVGASTAAAMDDLKSLQACRQREVFSARFQSDYYALTKFILKANGVENAYISEHHYGNAARKLVLNPQHGSAQFFAQATIGVISAQPIRLFDKSEGASDHPVFENPNAFAAFCIGLAATVYALKPDSNPEECLESATEVVKVTYLTFLSKMQTINPSEVLGHLYTDLADLLP